MNIQIHHPIAITLSPDETALVLDALAQIPLKTSYPLFSKIVAIVEECKKQPGDEVKVE